MKRLSVVVTCTERKAIAVAPTLQARRLSAGTLLGKADEWCGRIAEADNRLPLTNLYRGEHWVQTLGLMRIAADMGFDAELWVASAGVGLQQADRRFPAYGATFTHGHEDTVADTGEDGRRWWSAIGSSLDASSLPELRKGHSVLLVLSDVYAKVMCEELRALGRSGGDVLLVGGSEDIEGLHRLPANGALRNALGGTMMALNVRMAVAWLSRCRDLVLDSPKVGTAWRKWASRVEKPDRYDRQPLSDDEVKQYIVESSARYPGIARTRLHRMLRDSGRACEQKRFAELYKEAMREEVASTFNTGTGSRSNPS